MSAEVPESEAAPQDESHLSDEQLDDVAGGIDPWVPISKDPT